MLENNIGINAGTIWCLLSRKNALSIREIGEYTNFRESFIYYALGWLARENKIRFFEKEGAVYVELTNSMPEIYY
ncbi:MAG: winged helix-turn-helix domain-containing protein [Dysgonamonadaceae bacterium]|jgi:hypothetical protein|nr:winged helix-turn-helix domain-containing protein [Dysgonamonadaceae bacterium]